MGYLARRAEVQSTATRSGTRCNGTDIAWHISTNNQQPIANNLANRQ